MKPIFLLPLLFAAVLLGGCGTFERKWNAAVADYRSGKAKAPEGPWVGTWTTTTNGHTGDLRAIVSRSTEEPGEYDFHYHATWARIFSGGYKVRFPVARRASTYVVDGEKNMGLFGTFRHKGTISGSRFDATYSNDKGELGDFALKRPE